ncbi:MAG: 2OG-Fe dioxygenase family protein [bacterium]|nr:2OG-Fe dioxygenase family protein [bacterium]
MNLINTNHAVKPELNDRKYSFIQANEICIAPGLEVHRKQLWLDWGRLEPDKYLKDGAKFRLRRFGLFYFLPAAKELIFIPSGTYYQPASLNAYAGGIERKFAPLLDSTVENSFFRELVLFNFEQFPVEPGKLTQPWKVDAHQFRVVATASEAGEPTPEGVHRDGDDFAVIHLVNRKNVRGGINTVHDNDRKQIDSLTLHQPMDSVFLWDPYIMHAVTGINPENPDEPAIRDILAIGYKHCPGFKRPTGSNNPSKSS